jgi:DCN1-like protein 1/2
MLLICYVECCVTGLNLLPGSKRKCPTQFNSSEDNVEVSDGPSRSLHFTPLKRQKECSVSTKSGVWECNAGTPFFNSSSDCREDTNIHNSRGCLQNSPCIVEDSLAKGFEGCISMKCSF